MTMHAPEPEGLASRRLAWTARDALVVLLLPLPLALVCLAWSVTQCNFDVRLARAFVGLYFTGGLLAMALVRKPGAALIGEVMLGLWEVIAVRTVLYGVMPEAYCSCQTCGDYMIAGLMQGLGMELGFLLFRYRDWRFPPFAFAGALGFAVVTLQGFITSGQWEIKDPLVLAISWLSVALPFAALAWVLSRRTFHRPPASPEIKGGDAS